MALDTFKHPFAVMNWSRVVKVVLLPKRSWRPSEARRSFLEGGELGHTSSAQSLLQVDGWGLLGVIRTKLGLAEYRSSALTSVISLLPPGRFRGHTRWSRGFMAPCSGIILCGAQVEPCVRQVA